MIVSTLIPCPDGYGFAIFDTYAMDKSFVVALVNGDIDGDDWSEVGQECFRRFNAYVERVSPGEQAHLVAVTQQDVGTNLIDYVFSTFEAGSGIVFVCEGDEIYQTIYSLLGISHPQGWYGPH